jgi:hypothetical protein
LRGWFSHLAWVLLCLLLIALGEWLPPMRAVQRLLDAHSSAYRTLFGVTIVMTLSGILLLALTQFLVRVPETRRARPVQTARTDGVVKGPGRFFSGISISAGFSDELRMWRVKKVFRDGVWWRVPRWRRMTLMMLGAILLFYGLFGLLFLLFPPGVKFFLALVALYATARTLYAFATDRPFRD